uniref:Uncharacterized protein n=1 Tax=Vibrio tasmaniensis TaxID=212663 RepID=A0A0H4A0Z1_9VIBR|nr:hypothetical protein [Vibrio tasmaniensis]
MAFSNTKMPQSLLDQLLHVFEQKHIQICNRVIFLVVV